MGPTIEQRYVADVSATRHGTLHSPVLWFTMDRGTAGGRQCRDYTVADDGGRQLLSARAFNWSRDIVLADSDGTPILMIRRSRIFALSGRAVVLELPAQRPIGEVGRSGRFSDSTGQMRGRFRDARSARERASESVFQAAAEALLGNGDSVASGPNSFLLDIDGVLAGTLSYSEIPLGRNTEPAVPSRAARLASRLLPARSLKALRALTAPRGWKFHHLAPPPEDPRVQIAAALFAIELSRW